MRTSDVTIAIPVYNGARLLGESLGSALAQTVPADRVVVWDNASSDDTLRIARSMLPDADIVTSDRNRGAAVNFDRSAQAATTDWFMWLAADDRIDARYIEACLQAVARSTKPVRAVLTGIRYIDPDGAEIRTETSLGLGSASMAARTRAVARKAVWSESYCLFRHSALMESPRFTPEYGTDVLLIWWFVLRGPLLVVDEVLLDYRVTPGRTVEEQAEGLLAGNDPHPYWRKVRMFRRLWGMAAADDLTIRTTWTARRELLMALLTTAAALHLSEDVEVRAAAIEAQPDLRWRKTRRLGINAARVVVRTRESISFGRRGTANGVT